MVAEIAYVGMDVHKETIAVSVASTGTVEPDYIGTVRNTPEAVEKLVTRLRQRATQRFYCYEAGPCGYGLQRQLIELGEDCIVVSPSLIPRKPGDRQKNDRRDATMLAQRLRGGDLTPVWIPDGDHEAMRDLVRAREAVVRQRIRVSQQLLGFQLRQGRTWDRKNWTKVHMEWLRAQRFDSPAHRVVMREMLAAVDASNAQAARLEHEIRQLVDGWSMAPVVHALQTLRGFRVVNAAVVVSELGDFHRFPSARAMMTYIGLVPREHSSGERVWRGGITKAGNVRARTAIVEAAWTYRWGGRSNFDAKMRGEDVPPEVSMIAEKAHHRLTGRFRHLLKTTRKPNLAATAVARELAGFVWAVGQVAQPRLDDIRRKCASAA